MKNLLYKEFRLCMQPMVLIFYCAAFMLLIPNYMYLVPFFFTGNALFNSMQVSVSNSDALFTAMLPVSKRNVVKSKFAFVICVQLIMILLCAGMIFLNHALLGQSNKAGIDACPALFLGAFLVYAVFNATFMPIFYKNGYKAEKAFLISTLAVFIFIFVFEGIMIAAAAASGQIAVFAWIENNIDCWPASPSSVAIQLISAAAGAGIYALVTYSAYRKCCKYFEKVDV